MVDICIYPTQCADMSEQQNAMKVHMHACRCNHDIAKSSWVFKHNNKKGRSRRLNQGPQSTSNPDIRSVQRKQTSTLKKKMNLTSFFSSKITKIAPYTHGMLGFGHHPNGRRPAK